ncbi:hypothetical protein V8D89_011433 [Ganoderma adspersum]
MSQLRRGLRPQLISSLLLASTYCSPTAEQSSTHVYWTPACERCCCVRCAQCAHHYRHHRSRKVISNHLLMVARLVISILVSVR